jgi:tRNA pseudouridine38-40 synthase
MRIALGIEYNGAPFHGWQSQPDGSAVQNALERALSEVAGKPIAVIAAGRTDSGVHATMQVAHFDSDIERPESAWVRGVNALLLDAVAVHWAAPVADEFHARFTATGRHYTYLLLDRPVRPALLDQRAGWYHQPLALAAMREGAAALIGRNDFTAFRAAECQAKSPVRTLDRLDIAREGNMIRFDLHADAFLYRMVRNIIGALVYVGSRRQPPAWIGSLLAGRDRSLAAPTFDGAGLYFTGVDYPVHFNLPATIVPLRIPLS